MDADLATITELESEVRVNRVVEPAAVSVSGVRRLRNRTNTHPALAILGRSRFVYCLLVLVSVVGVKALASSCLYTDIMPFKRMTSSEVDARLVETT